MATKKSSKSSKTAHVLNVLSGPNPEAVSQDTAAQETVTEKSSTPPQQVQSVAVSEVESVAFQESKPASIEVESKQDEALADAIREGLERDLEQDAGQEDEADLPQEEESIPQQEVEESPSPSEESSLELEPTSEVEELTPEVQETVVVEAAKQAPQEEEMQPVATENAPADAPVMEESQPVVDAFAEAPAMEEMLLELETTVGSGDNISYVNVMQALVEEQAPRYLKMLSVCPCARCTADVKALALTNLPAKYIVMEKGEVIPTLTVYEKRYSQILTAQLIKACETILHHPRHVEKKP